MNDATLEFLNTHRTHEPHVNFHVDYHKIQLKQKKSIIRLILQKTFKALEIWHCTASLWRFSIFIVDSIQ